MKKLQTLLTIASFFMVILGFGQTTLCNYKFENNLTPEAGGIGSPTLTASASVTYYTGNSGQSGCFASGGTKYFELTISSTGYQNITISFYGRSSQASGDSWDVYGDFGSGYGSLIYTKTLNITFSIGNYSLSSSYDNKSTIKLKFIATGSASSTYRLDDLILTGTSIYSNSIESNIVKKSAWSEPTNIAYGNYLTSSGLSTSNALEVGKFTINDGGSDNTDADVVFTKLTDISFSVANWSNIKALALFDGVTNIGEITSITSSAVSFSTLTLEALDEGTKDFSLYATFKSSVTDNQNIGFTVSSAVADVAGSAFAASDAGAAATDNTGNNNKIVVTATHIIFSVQPVTVLVNVIQSPSPQVAFVDINSNIDIDIAGATYNISLSTTSTFDGTSTTTISPVDGVSTFSNLIYTLSNTNRTNTASEASSTFSDVTSNTFEVQNPVNPAVGVVYISEVSDANSTANEFIELYNSGSNVCTLSTSLLKRINSSGIVEATWDFTADLASLGSIDIPVDGYLVISRGAVSQAAFESEWGTLPIGANFNRGTSAMYFGAATARRWQLLLTVAKATTIIDDTQNPVAGSGKVAKQLTNGVWTTFTGTNHGSPGTQAGDVSKLPIELISFTAYLINEVANINWQSASEINNDYFSIERSIDGIEWQNIATIDGAGNSNIPISYTFTDDYPLSKISYYRLRQTDFDGNFSFSKTISLSTKDKDFNIQKIYSNGTTLFLDILNANNSKAFVKIAGIDGKIVREYNGDLEKDKSQYKLFIGNSLKGIYMISIESSKAVDCRKIVF